jgi:hypothetical protein
VNDAEREKKIEQLVLSYLKKASPEELHIYVARSNYDGNTESVKWLINNAALDRGTALLLYWYLGAAYYSEFASEREVPEFQRSKFHNVLLLEQRIIDGFYSGSSIYCDPEKSEGGGPKEMRKSKIKRPISQLLLSPSPGEHVNIDSDGYEEGIPIFLAEKISALFDE